MWTCIEEGKKNVLIRYIRLLSKRDKERGRPKKTWLKVVVEQREKIGLNVCDANNRSNGA